MIEVKMLCECGVLLDIDPQLLSDLVGQVFEVVHADPHYLLASTESQISRLYGEMLETEKSAAAEVKKKSELDPSILRSVRGAKQIAKWVKTYG